MMMIWIVLTLTCHVIKPGVVRSVEQIGQSASYAMAKDIISLQALEFQEKLNVNIATEQRYARKVDNR